MKFVHAIEGLSLWVGRAFGWCILILTLSVSYEVFVRYVLNAPTVWAFDMMIQMYGALFLMCGAYALAQIIVPVIGFAAAVILPGVIFANRRGMSRAAIGG